MTPDWMSGPHRRLNRLTGEWVIVAAHRALRPWRGQIEKTSDAPQLAYDPNCYLCPGNERVGGVRNPNYKSTFVFDNDYPALLPETPIAFLDDRDLLIARSEAGVCRVVCFSPRHDLSIPQMDQTAITKLVDTWCEQDRQLAALPSIRYVQIFENRGAMMGASNPHPHCQIWASASIPNEISKEDTSQRVYFDKHRSCLLCDYVAAEKDSERLVFRNSGFVAFVPFWAVWPFEVLIVSNRHISSMNAMESSEREQLADMLQRITRSYDRIFDAPFPYSMGFHQQPSGEADQGAWHLHAHYFPPLLRGATIRKFMAGYELLATPQRDVSPEWAAGLLRSACNLGR